MRTSSSSFGFVRKRVSMCSRARPSRDCIASSPVCAQRKSVDFRLLVTITKVGDTPAARGENRAGTPRLCPTAEVRGGGSCLNIENLQRVVLGSVISSTYLTQKVCCDGSFTQLQKSSRHLRINWYSSNWKKKKNRSVLPIFLATTLVHQTFDATKTRNETLVTVVCGCPVGGFTYTNLRKSNLSQFTNLTCSAQTVFEIFQKSFSPSQLWIRQGFFLLAKSDVAPLNNHKQHPVLPLFRNSRRLCPGAPMYV